LTSRLRHTLRKIRDWPGNVGRWSIDDCLLPGYR
jgi:hypothetical protein